jgi:excisionase family DNA binding protein
LYITIKETAEYLSVPEATVKSLIQQKKIRAIFDGEEYLIYKEQFSTHLKQMEKYKQLIEEPIPESIDVKDED